MGQIPEPYMTNRSEANSGLGLTICKNLVQKTEGKCGWRMLLYWAGTHKYLFSRQLSLSCGAILYYRAPMKNTVTTFAFLFFLAGCSISSQQSSTEPDATTAPAPKESSMTDITPPSEAAPQRLPIP